MYSCPRGWWITGELKVFQGNRATGLGPLLLRRDVRLNHVSL